MITNTFNLIRRLIALVFGLGGLYFVYCGGAFVLGGLTVLTRHGDAGRAADLSFIVLTTVSIPYFIGAAAMLLIAKFVWVSFDREVA